MNLQTILMIFFFQRGRWVRMVGKEKKKSWGTSTETLKPPNMLCLTRTRSLPSVSEIVQHPVGNTYIKPCNTSRKNASMYFTANSCRGAPCTDSRHSSWFHAVSILLSSAPTLLQEAFRSKAVQGPFIILATTTQNDNSLPTSSWQKTEKQFALFMHMAFPFPRLPQTLHTYPIVQHLNVLHLKVKGFYI